MELSKVRWAIELVLMNGMNQFDPLPRWASRELRIIVEEIKKEET